MHTLDGEPFMLGWSPNLELNESGIEVSRTIVDRNLIIYNEPLTSMLALGLPLPPSRLNEHDQRIPYMDLLFKWPHWIAISRRLEHGLEGRKDFLDMLTMQSVSEHVFAARTMTGDGI